MVEIYKKLTWTKIINKIFYKLNEIGPLESVVEIPSQKHYYDGSLHLNVANVNC